ncbi:MAG: DUF3592 domain-containing protein [Desulfohalobiaceae bacterium]|nr:DUF3592 domain-containing protein [Desulfohalobiaceae bacterium]
MSHYPQPPRPVPLDTALHGLFGGLRCQVSWLFLGLCVSFLFGFGLDSSSILLDQGETGTASGTLIERQETIFTDAVVGSSGLLHGQGESIYRYVYNYEIGGRAYVAESLAGKSPLTAGSEVAVEYLASRPCVSRIPDMSPELRLGGGSVPLVIVLGITLVAVASVFSMTKKRLRWYHLLKQGEPATAEAVDKVLLSRTRHGHEWYQVFWEFFDSAGRRNVLEDRPYYTDRVALGDRRTVLYDRKNPRKAVLFAGMPEDVDRQADPRPASAISAAGTLLIPLGAAAAALLSTYLEFTC